MHWSMTNTGPKASHIMEGRADGGCRRVVAVGQDGSWWMCVCVEGSAFIPCVIGGLPGCFFCGVLLVRTFLFSYIFF